MKFLSNTFESAISAQNNIIPKIFDSGYFDSENGEDYDPDK